LGYFTINFRLPHGLFQLENKFTLNALPVIQQFCICTVIIRYILHSSLSQLLHFQLSPHLLYSPNSTSTTTTLLNPAFARLRIHYVASDLPPRAQIYHLPNNIRARKYTITLHPNKLRTRALIPYLTCHLTSTLPYTRRFCNCTILYSRPPSFPPHHKSTSARTLIPFLHILLLTSTVLNLLCVRSVTLLLPHPYNPRARKATCEITPHYN